MTRLDELRRGRRTGLPVPDRRRTVRRLLDEWLDQLPGTVSVGTLVTYKRTARLYVTPTVGARRLVDLQPGDGTTMLDRMQG